MVSFLFRISMLVGLLAVCWWSMMAVHELGHVVGAWLTGGTVRRVVLHPLAVSRTDVVPNPHPAVVVWTGPLLGCLVPLTFASLVPGGWKTMRGYLHFFAGFCLVANGAYLGFGSFEGVGDCGEMLKTGTPRYVLWLFAAVTIPAGLWIWHRLGSWRRWFA